MTYPIPTAALDDRLAFVGTSGSGKTYAAGTAVERLLSRGARVVIVDPLDVWFGLRLSADGKTPAFPVVIFGGAHGDLPINEHSGALLSETVATTAESCVVSLAGLQTKSAERRFMLAFLETLYRRATGDPFHIVFDEADLWAPQKTSEPKLQSLMEQIVRRGRIKGFIPWLITQRPAVLSKDVLSQVDGLVAMKLVASQDRDALSDWIKGQADEKEGRAIRDALPTKQRGEAVVWLPARGILAQATFPAKATFDSSRTPKRGERRHEDMALKPIDIAALRDKLATVEAEVSANDPAKLKAEIARLTREAKAPATNPQEIAAAEHRGYMRGKIEGYADALKLAEPFLPKLRQIAATATELAGGIEQWSHHKPDPVVSPRPVAAARPPAAPRPAIQVGPGASLPKGERAVLIVVAQYPDGVTREQLTVLTGYKRSSRDTYLQRLREKGFVETSADQITGTPAGIAALGTDYEPLPTGAALREYWLRRLPEGERKVLEVLIAAYPAPVGRDSIDEATGYKRSSRDTYIQRLRSRMLVRASSDGVKASDDLFDV